MTTTMPVTHKIEEIIGARNLVIIGCVCGWVHSETVGADRVAATKRCRAAMRAHKSER
jgi:hypothetical protein